MPETGALDGKEVALLAGQAPITRQSGPMEREGSNSGARAGLRKAIYMPVLVTPRRNPAFGKDYRRRREVGMPAKVVIAALMRKPVVLAKALIRDGRKWTPYSS